MPKPKAVYFYQYLPPWRIDVFNELGKLYDLTIVFTNAESEGFTYNRAELLSKLVGIKTIFLSNGIKIGSRPIRFGIFKLLRQIKPDVVFSHEYQPTSILAAMYKQLGFFNYTYILTTSDNLKMAESSSGLKAKAREYVLNHSNGVIVYSEAVKRWYQKTFPRLRVEICPNIQKPQSLLNNRDSFPALIKKYRQEYHLESCNVMLFVGRLVEEKGLDLLLAAFAKSNVKDYKLVIVGNGNKEAVLREQAKQLNIQDQVIFAGFYTGVNLYAWYDIANYFILPSRYEPFGAVVNEALVYGCPVVASKHIGAVDFIDESNGILFDPLNEGEFVATIQEACARYAGLPGAREDLMRYSFDEYVASFQKIIDEE